MKKELLIKYISDNANKAEQKLVQEWIKEKESNLSYFIELKTLWMQLNIPQERASAEDMLMLDGIFNKKKTAIPKVERTKTTTHIIRYGVVACIALLLGVSFYLLYNKFNSTNEISNPTEHRVELSMLPIEQKHTLYTNKGVKGSVDLPDGSKVWLNSDSKITYPDRFEGNTREVEMSGECYFEVASDSLKPMIISTNKNFQVKVLGTKFNIRAYDNDLEAKATLIEGSIEIIKDNNAKDILAAKLQPSQSYIAYNSKKAATVEVVDTTKQLAWTKGILIFEQTPIEEVIKELERWHGTEFVIKDKEVLKNKFTAEFNSESIVQIMEMLKYCSLINYRIKDNKVWLFFK